MLRVVSSTLNRWLRAAQHCGCNRSPIHPQNQRREESFCKYNIPESIFFHNCSNSGASTLLFILHLGLTVLPFGVLFYKIGIPVLLLQLYLLRWGFSNFHCINQKFNRKIPFHVRKKVKKELQCLEDDNIIEKGTESMLWFSPIVTSPIPNGPDQTCSSTDMSVF